MKQQDNSPGIDCQAGSRGPVEPDILVLGVGNILKGDEGVGVQVIKELQQLGLPEKVELLDGGTAGLDLVPYFQDRKKIIIIDCVDTPDPPGTIYRLRPEDLEEIKTFTISSLHQVALPEAIGLSRLLGNQAEFIIIGVTPKDFSQYKMEISPELKKSIPRLIGLVMKEAGVN